MNRGFESMLPVAKSKPPKKASENVIFKHDVMFSLLTWKFQLGFTVKSKEESE